MVTKPASGFYSFIKKSSSDCDSELNRVENGFFSKFFLSCVELAQLKSNKMIRTPLVEFLGVFDRRLGVPCSIPDKRQTGKIIIRNRLHQGSLTEGYGSVQLTSLY